MQGNNDSREADVWPKPPSAQPKYKVSLIGSSQPDRARKHTVCILIPDSKGGLFLGVHDVMGWVASTMEGFGGGFPGRLVRR